MFELSDCELSTDIVIDCKLGFEEMLIKLSGSSACWRLSTELVIDSIDRSISSSLTNEPFLEEMLIKLLGCCWWSSSMSSSETTSDSWEFPSLVSSILALIIEGSSWTSSEGFILQNELTYKNVTIISGWQFATIIKNIHISTPREVHSPHVKSFTWFKLLDVILDPN